jgi:DNA-binding XRE family transcriptional regulator
MADRLISSDDVLAEELRDPEFRAEWERTALARWLAVEVAHYRAEHGLSQRQLAERLGVHQSDVARMETGEHTPSLERHPPREEEGPAAEETSARRGVIPPGRLRGRSRHGVEPSLSEAGPANACHTPKLTQPDG